MHRIAAVTTLLLAACSQRVYSPPTQAFGVGPVTSLPSGGRSFDIEVAGHSQVFDPKLLSGAARYNESIARRTDVSVEGTMFRLASTGSSHEDPDVYAGRVGLRHSPGEDLALFAGTGGGYSPAGGSFVSADGGIGVGIDNCVVVPVAQVSGFISQPLDAHPIDVSEGDVMTTDTPSRTLGVTARGGVRVSLTPAACRRGETGTWVYAGLDYTAVTDTDTQDELFGIGLGLSVGL